MTQSNLLSACKILFNVECGKHFQCIEGASAGGSGGDGSNDDDDDYDILVLCFQLAQGDAVAAAVVQSLAPDSRQVVRRCGTSLLCVFAVSAGEHSR